MASKVIISKAALTAKNERIKELETALAEKKVQIDRLHKFAEIERGLTDGIEEDYKREIRQLQADNKTMHDLLSLCKKWFKEHEHPKDKCVSRYCPLRKSDKVIVSAQWREDDE